MEELSAGSRKVPVMRKLALALFGAACGLLVGLGVGMSGVVNVQAGAWCLLAAAILLSAMVWLLDEFSQIPKPWRPTVGCSISQLIFISLLFFLKWTLIQEITRADEASRKDWALRTEITGGTQWFVFNPEPMPDKRGYWRLHLYNSMGPIIKDAKAVICPVANLDGNASDLLLNVLRKRGSVCSVLEIGDIPSVESGMGSLDFFNYAPLKNGSYLIDLMTRTKRFTEKLQLLPNMREIYEIYAGDKLVAWGCNGAGKCTWCSSACKDPIY